MIIFRHRAKNELEKGGRLLPKETSKDCPNCHKSLSEQMLSEKHFVCDCGYHFRMKARQRIQMVVDRGSFQEFSVEMHAGNPLAFPGYQEKLEKAHMLSGEEEAVVTGRGRIAEQDCVLFSMEPSFMMASMGTVVGEKITCAIEYAEAHRLPVVGFTMSGGARMQEGLLSLMQMAKTAGALKRHSDAGLLSIMILCNPTTGGVTASFAMLGDILLAEPGATIGFAGRRVIEETLHKALPKEFQTSEFLLSHGFLDGILDRREEKQCLGSLLRMHTAVPRLDNDGSPQAASERKGDAT